MAFAQMLKSVFIVSGSEEPIILFPFDYTTYTGNFSIRSYKSVFTKTEFQSGMRLYSNQD